MTILSYQAMEKKKEEGWKMLMLFIKCYQKDRRKQCKTRTQISLRLAEDHSFQELKRWYKNLMLELLFSFFLIMDTTTFNFIPIISIFFLL